MAVEMNWVESSCCCLVSPIIHFTQLSESDKIKLIYAYIWYLLLQLAKLKDYQEIQEGVPLIKSARD